jgi:hypothetical protein
MKNRLLKEELDRIRELIGIRVNNVISESISPTPLLKSLQKSLDDIFNSNKVVKNINRATGRIEDIFVNGIEVSESFLNTLKSIIKDDDWFDALDDESKKILGNILSKDSDAVGTSWKTQIDALYPNESFEEAQKKLYKQVYAASEKQNITVDAVVEDLFNNTQTNEKNWILINLFKKKISDGVDNLSELEKKAAISTAKIGLENTAKDIEFGWFKFLRNYWLGGVAKKLLIPTKVGRKIYPRGTTFESALDNIQSTIAKKIEKNYNIVEDLETLTNLLSAAKLSVTQNNEKLLKKYLFENNILKGNSQFEDFIKRPDVKKLLEDSNLGTKQALTATFKQKLSAYADLIFPKVEKVVIDGNEKIISNRWQTWARRLGNTIAWKDPQGWKELRRLYATSGVPGVIIDKLIVSYVVHTLITTIIEFSKKALENKANRDQLDELRAYQSEFCAANSKVFSDEECERIKKGIENLKPPLPPNFTNILLQNTPFGMDKTTWERVRDMFPTYIDDIWRLGSYIYSKYTFTFDDFKTSLNEYPELKDAYSTLENYGWNLDGDIKENVNRMKESLDRMKESSKESIEDATKKAQETLDKGKEKLGDLKLLAFEEWLKNEWGDEYLPETKLETVNVTDETTGKTTTYYRATDSTAEYYFYFDGGTFKPVE